MTPGTGRRTVAERVARRPPPNPGSCCYRWSGWWARRAHAADDPAIRQVLDRAANQHPTAGSAVRARPWNADHGRRLAAWMQGKTGVATPDDVALLTEELRRPVALIISGAASLGSYQGGFLYYYLRQLTEARRLAERTAAAAGEQWFAPGEGSPLQLITGASSGSINAVIAALTSCQTPVSRPAAEPVLDHLDPGRWRRADVRRRGATRRTAVDAADPRGRGAHAGCLEQRDVVAGSDLLGRSRAQRHAHAFAHGDAARRSQPPDPAPERADDDHVARRPRPDAGDRPLRAAAGRARRGAVSEAVSARGRAGAARRPSPTSPTSCGRRRRSRSRSRPICCA